MIDHFKDEIDEIRYAMETPMLYTAQDVEIIQDYLSGGWNLTSEQAERLIATIRAAWAERDEERQTHQEYREQALARLRKEKKDKEASWAENEKLRRYAEEFGW